MSSMTRNTGALGAEESDVLDLTEVNVGVSVVALWDTTLLGVEVLALVPFEVEVLEAGVLHVVELDAAVLHVDDVEAALVEEEEDADSAATGFESRDLALF